MLKWMKDGLIGLGAVGALTFIVALATPNPYTFSSNLIFSLGLGLLIGAPGGILFGRNREGWAWPFAGGIVTSMIFGVVGIVFGAF